MDSKEATDGTDGQPQVAQIEDNDMGFSSPENNGDEYETAQNEQDLMSPTILESEGISVDVTDQDAFAVNAIDTMVPENGPNLKFMRNIADFGECQPYWEFNGEPIMLHFDAYPKGGLYMRDEDGIIPQATKDLAKKVAGKLIKGQISDMSSIAQPAYLHGYITQHGLHKNDMSWCTELKLAANTTDAIQRMKHIIKFLIAPNMINPTCCGCRIPLNPILGETYQREMEDGTKFYAEQIVHRPQITAFLLEDGDGDYTLSGSFTIKGWLNGVNSLGGSKKDNNIRLRLKDGTEYTWAYPMLYIGNITAGNQYQVYMDKVELKDLTNDLVATLHYNPYTDNSYAGMFKRSFSFMSKKKGPAEGEKPQRGDDVIIEIFKETGEGKKKERVELAKGSGSWLSHLIFDDQLVWRVTDDIPQWLPVAEKQKDGSIVLPSDMERRPDIPYLIMKEFHMAEEFKLKIEQIQRNDRKLREKVEKARKKAKK